MATIELDDNVAKALDTIARLKNISINEELERFLFIQYAKTKTDKPLSELTDDEKEDIYMGWEMDNMTEEDKQPVSKEELNKEFGFNLCM